jgi:hypothetical protein
MIQRYAWNPFDPQMVEYDNGDWIKWEDIENLFKELSIPYGCTDSFQSGYMAAIKDIMVKMRSTLKSN